MVDYKVIVESLSVSYRGNHIPALSNVSFALEDAECLGIVGESGSGKSTAALAVMGLLGRNAELSANSIKVGSCDVLKARKKALLSLRRSFVGVVFQDPSASWNPSRKIVDQLLQPFPRKDHQHLREKLIGYMEQVGIEKAQERIGVYPHNLSGGMLQRIMIAGALLSEPQLLIADEPTSALDVTVQADLLGLLSHLQRQRSLSMLMISHNLAVVAKISNRVLVMYAGTIVEAGPTKNVLLRPMHPYTKSLLASVPGVEKERKKPLDTTVSALVALSGCPYSSRCVSAIDICHTRKPELREIQGAQVACHRAEELESNSVISR